MFGFKKEISSDEAELIRLRYRASQLKEKLDVQEWGNSLIAEAKSKSVEERLAVLEKLVTMLISRM